MDFLTALLELLLDARDHFGQPWIADKTRVTVRAELPPADLQGQTRQHRFQRGIPDFRIGGKDIRRLRDSIGSEVGADAWWRVGQQSDQFDAPRTEPLGECQNLVESLSFGFRDPKRKLDPTHACQRQQPAKHGQWQRPVASG